MKALGTILLASIVVFEINMPSVPHPRVPLSAPTYYLTVQVLTCDKVKVGFFGASNLPPGAVITTLISDFAGDGWNDDSDYSFATIDKDGFFRGEIHPKKNIQFHHNSLLQAYFAPYRPKQPDEILKIVGRNGQDLGGLGNPQVFQVSGGNYGLETITRVTWCGEGVDRPLSP